ncbi:aminoacyl-tRNA hydrolase [Spartinivicinus poritis]|uniref:peptidyl-tRNA hydrolase n=1 Tax=Spartinivicinus poritis TaxID=2994640 RepID=A0ABT5UEG9_9GAMM|nr:aminoacyl-tRNA hydrolase [Spartinivicinus sp. A2-2]MDE1464765.1 aminoacyl-tRNA hydrolase [Spartinivicinus sp. A2-2]
MDTPKAYFVIRSDLELNPAKLAVQIGHGTDMIWQHQIIDQASFNAWLDSKQGDRRKIVLEVKSLEKLTSLKEKLVNNGFYCYDIVDSGYNFVEANTHTGIVIFPTAANTNTIKRLRVYK